MTSVLALTVKQNVKIILAKLGGSAPDGSAIVFHGYKESPDLKTSAHRIEDRARYATLVADCLINDHIRKLPAVGARGKICLAARLGGVSLEENETAWRIQDDLENYVNEIPNSHGQGYYFEKVATEGSSYAEEFAYQALRLYHALSNQEL